MFVSKSKYDKLLHRFNDTVDALHNTVLEWNALVRRINALGGEDFLQNAKMVSSTAQFTRAELIELRNLCHPDKHGNSQLSNHITARLNELLK